MSEHLPIPNAFQSSDEFISGCLLLIDKPLTWTSFDVVNKIKGYVRHHLEIPLNHQGHTQRFKIGHAGTLDPLATGLLVICTGKLTKSIDSFQGGAKEYTGTIKFGQTTPSYDLETAPEGEYPTGHITPQLISETAQSFLGTSMQLPPAFSAKQVNGQRAYKAARKGIAVDIPAAGITITEFEITRAELPEIDFRIVCTKGTYIRSIAHEFGQRLGSGSHLTKLRRTASNPFQVRDAISPEELMQRLTGLSEKIQF